MSADHQTKSPSSPRRHDEPIELRATPARQGIAGQGVRYVLGIGLALVVIAFAIIYFTNFW